MVFMPVSDIPKGTWLEGDLSGGYTGLFYRGDKVLINFTHDGNVHEFTGDIVGDVYNYVPLSVEIHCKDKE